MDTPIRKYQKQKDYQRHKLFRKMKRRRKAAIEQAKDAPMKQLRRRLKIPKFEDGKEGSQQMQLGPRYWRDQTIYHDWQNSTIDGGALPEVIVSPTNDASWLFSTGKYVHNPRKPLADKYTRKVVSDYLSKFDDESAKDYNERISRLADVLDIRGVQFKKNDVKSGKLKGRAHYIHQSATAYIDSMKDIFAEVAHPWQYAKGNNNIEEEVGTGKYDSDSDPRGGTRYAYPDTAEGETHSFFEPALTEWIETGKISKSSPILNNELSRQKIKPKDRMEVADSASSWNRQAIERRLLANPDQLPLYKRIQYGLFDYPLLDKKKAFGGNLFDDGKDDKPNVFQLADGTFVNSHNEPLDVLDYAGVEDPTKWTYVDKKGNRYTPKATRTLTEGEQFTQRQIENEQNTRPFEFTPYIEGANEGAAAASLMMGFPFNMAGSAYYTAKASRDAYNRNYLGAALNGLGAVTPAGSGILQSAKRFLPKEKTLITAENTADIIPEQWAADDLFSLSGANLKEKEIISYLENAEPVPRDILRRPLSSLNEEGKVQWSVANGVNDAIKFLRSGGYKARLKNLGYTSDEANYIIDSQIDNIRKADVVTLPKYNKMYSRHGMATPYRRKDGTMGYQIALQPEKSIAYNPRVTAAHEAFHVGSNQHGIKDFASLPQDIREHNASIRPIVNDDYDAKLVFEGLNDEELRARALEVLARSERANMSVMDYINKWGADPIPGKGPGILRNPNYDHNANDLRTYFTQESLKRYLEGVAGIAAPLAGGTALLGYNSLGQPVDTYKHGKDSGIHINPKNRGKFNALKKRTGKTTEQLTHSKNPLTRKRAIFALNSKKWKH